jgi:hypothetical protein
MSIIHIDGKTLDVPEHGPLSREDEKVLATDRAGDLIRRLPGDVGQGDGGPHNYGLWCGHCGELLGRLGIFPERVQPKGPPARTAHCTRCHSTTFVRGKDVEVLPPSLMAGTCIMPHCRPVGVSSPSVR